MSFSKHSFTNILNLPMSNKSIQQANLFSYLEVHSAFNVPWVHHETIRFKKNTPGKPYSHNFSFAQEGY